MALTRELIEEHGVQIPIPRPAHREDEYHEAGHDVLLEMQQKHFWYLGRHRVIARALARETRRTLGKTEQLEGIDMGGGCGGWIEFLHEHSGNAYTRLALGDSSLRALTMSESTVGQFAERYQIDLLDLPWEAEWDVVFLLDVLEHIPDHLTVLKQIRRTLRPGWLLYITTPALQLFWTYNDVVAAHQRRYSRRDYVDLARSANLELIRADYFMFLLSPLLLASRLMSRPPKDASLDEMREHATDAHKIPAWPINKALESIFSLEASAINHLRYPWGTSILAVLLR